MKNKYSQEYKRNRKRVQSFIRRAEKRGFVFPVGIVPEIPKKITPASIRRLESLTPEKLYKKARYAEPETGVILTAEKGLALEKQAKKERQKIMREIKKQEKLERMALEKASKAYLVEDEQAQYPDFSTIIISNFKNEMSTYNDIAGSIIDTWLSEIIARYGEEAVAEMIEKNANSGNFPNYQVVYNTEALLQKLASMMEVLDIPTSKKDEIISILEEHEGGWEVE